MSEFDTGTTSLAGLSRIVLDPAKHRAMISAEAVVEHDLLDITVAHRVTQIRSDPTRDDVMLVILDKGQSSKRAS